VENDHRGRLALHSATGRGTTVELFLPREPAPQQANAPKTARARTRKTPRVKSTNGRTGSILLVNDDATMLNKVARLLRSAGHRVAEVESGHEAVARSRADKFDVIVLDYHLRKDESATQTARDFVPDLKRNLPTTPIILTSASMQKLGAPEMFCDFFLEMNPSFWNEILDFINRCITIKASLRRKRAGSSRLARNNGTAK
jgi:CheY-like chemotaxis protein